jgi:hypothetical protein
MGLDQASLPESIAAWSTLLGWLQAGLCLKDPSGWLVNTSPAEPHARSTLGAVSLGFAASLKQISGSKISWKSGPRGLPIGALRAFRGGEERGWAVLFRRRTNFYYVN